MHAEARAWTDRLGLSPHPEGGFYRVTYQSELLIPQHGLPSVFGGPRHVSTAIYYLLSGTAFSALHRIKSDELWHHYAGGCLLVHVIHESGRRTDLRVGPGDFQAVAPAGCWFGARLADPDSYALAGCTVAPGFDFTDFEIAERDTLCTRFPEHTQLIRELTRE